jgi:hypothetical protein
VGLIAVLVVYSQLNKAIKTVDLSMLGYLADNQCLDGALGRAIDVYTSYSKKDDRIVGAALALVVVSIVVKVVMLLCSLNLCCKN